MEPTLIHLDPAQILLGDNARFAQEVPLEDAEVMRDSILDVGRILEPVGVVALAEPVRGFTHQLRYGFRRVAGATLANADGAGVLVPALVLDETDTVAVLKEQVAENVHRKTMSLMDTAAAVKRMLDAGMARPDVRTTFKRSNAWINMVLALLGLPKTIQARIHSGNIGLAAAYKLCKAPAEKRQAILDAAERDEQKVRDIEAKEEQQFSQLEAKIAETEQTLETAVADIDGAAAELELATIAMQEKEKAVFEVEERLETAKKNLKAAEDGKEKDRAEKAVAKLKTALKTAQAEFREAGSRLEAEEKRLAKAQTAKESVATRAEQLRQELEEKRNAPAPKIKKAKATVSLTSIEKASKEAGVETGKKRLSGPEMRKTIEDLAAVSYPTVAAIGQIIKDCFDSTITDGQMLKKLAEITGEKAAKKK